MGAADTLAHPQPVASAANKAREAAAQADLQKFMTRLRLANQGKYDGSLTPNVDRNWARIGIEQANKLLKVPIQAAAVRQYGAKAQVAEKFKKEFGAK
jgi:hypothetical protein